MLTDVKDLTGEALNYAVCKARGYEIVHGGKYFLEQAELHACHITPAIRKAHLENDTYQMLDEGVLTDIPDYVGDEVLVMRMINREKIGLEYVRENHWKAEWWNGIHLSTVRLGFGETAELAVLRCYVNKELGKQVDIPEGLV